MRDDAERFEVEGLTVRILQDEDCQSPREYDNLGTMVCWHRNYKLGDEHEFDSPEDFETFVKDKTNGVAIVLPLYLYDHSGISMSTGRGYPYCDPWDAGQVGYIYITRDKMKAEYSVKRIGKKLIERVTGYLRGEVEEYDRFIMGECYGYIVEDAEGNDLDSCWGFIGADWVKGEATRAAKYCAESRAKEHTEQLEREATSAGDVPLS